MALPEKYANEFNELTRYVTQAMPLLEHSFKECIVELMETLSSNKARLRFLRRLVPQLKRQLGGFVNDEWVHGSRPDTSGDCAYTVIIRAYGDPERMPRELMQKDQTALWRRELMKKPLEEIEVSIMEHMKDTKPRTMNRIGVEMMDKTADLLLGTPFEGALWRLAEKNELEFTMQAPVFFRKVTVTHGTVTQAIAELTQGT